jgi:hypothetical protein
VLGLPADAPSCVVSDRGAALHRAAKVGIPQRSPWNLEWYGPVRQDGASVSDALGRLSNPQQRLRERLFWIEQAEIFVKCIPMQGLQPPIEALAGSYPLQNQHDAAVLALISCFSTDANVEDSARWKTMLRMWIKTVTSEDFWSAFLDDEESGGFEPSATYEDFSQLRSNSLKLVTEPIAELARDAASRAELERCRRALGLIRTVGLPSDVVSTIEEDVLGPYEDALSRISKDIKTQCWTGVRQDRSSTELNKQPCSIAVSRWKEELEPRYSDFVVMAGIDTAAGFRATQDYAEFLASIGNALTWAGQWIEAETMLTEARDHLASDNPARERIEITLRNVGGSAAQQQFEAQFGEGKHSQLDKTPGASEQNHDSEVRNDTDQTANEDEEKPSLGNGVRGFLNLCEVIRLKCWQQVRPDSTPHENLALFKAAYQDFKRRASPWLAIIVDACRDNTDASARARNAAAKCLNSLAGGLICVNDLNLAQKLTLEALTLVLDHEELESEIKGQLEFIESEKQRSAPKSFRPAEPDSKNVGVGAPKTEAKGHLAIANLGGSSVRRWSLVAAVALLIVVGVLIPADRLSREWHPAVTAAENGVSTSTRTPGVSPVDFDAFAAKHGLTISSKPPRDALDQLIEAVPPPPPGFVLDTPQNRQPVTLPNGTNLMRPQDTNGLGLLTISNYSDDDAVVKLKTVSGARTMRFVYVRAMKDVTVSGIAPGGYLLQFSTGRDWDRTNRSFRENQTFAQFGNPLSFSENQMGDNSIEYSVQKITLHEVANGNVRKQPITAAEFDDGRDAQKE